MPTRPHSLKSGGRGGTHCSSDLLDSSSHSSDKLIIPALKRLEFRKEGFGEREKICGSYNGGVWDRRRILIGGVQHREKDPTQSSRRNRAAGEVRVRFSHGFFRSNLLRGNETSPRCNLSAPTWILSGDRSLLNPNMLNKGIRAQRKALDVLNTVGLSNSVLRLIERRNRVDTWIKYMGMIATIVVLYLFIRWTR
ncbi:hypothetical protein Bca101_080838 [Brassica carinata]